MSHLPRVNLDEPRWDQSSYIGRARYFFNVTNPLNIFVSSQTLDEARTIVLKYKAGEELPRSITMDDVYRAKDLYDSAFHPDTGEKMALIGRMSAQAPMNMFITGMMMTFYKSTPAVVFWQWFNQSFNAVVNYTNRSGTNAIPADWSALTADAYLKRPTQHYLKEGRSALTSFAFVLTLNISCLRQLAKSYVMATSGALATALTLNRMVKRAPPLIGRLVPFAAVAAANCINIPMMRIKELYSGIPVYDSNNYKLGDSKVAAKTGIATVIISRVIMGSPSMVLTPVIVNKLDQKGLFRRYPWSTAPVQTLVCGVILVFATPMACAIFSQRAQISVSRLEEDIQEEAAKRKPPAVIAYYNKGL